MDSKVEAYFKNIKGKKIAFCGIGRSNIPLTKLFAKYGAKVYACDKREKDNFKDASSELEKCGITLKCGEDYLDNLDVDIIFRAPGMYFNMPEITAFRERGIVVTSEIETFFDLCPCKIYAITGTDGKTTTTTIVSNILEKSGKKVLKGGNIGIPLLPKIEEISVDDVAVVELSSFMLISMRKGANVSAITNIYPDHLNVHKDMQEYIGAKMNILLHQNAYSKTILNYDNEETKKLSSYVRGTVRYFSTKQKPEKRGAFLDDDGYLCYFDGKNTEKIVHRDEIKIPGMHNIENYLTAIAIVYGDVESKYIAQVANEFGGVEHRIEFVRELNCVRYYNDSIATSPASVTAGLCAFGTKVIIIAGGSDKQLDYSTLSGAINKYVKVLVLMGETAEKIELAVKNDKTYDENSIKILQASDMKQAVELARENAVKGDVISLSPASASFDKYKDFEDRGRHFKSIVKELD